MPVAEARAARTLFFAGHDLLVLDHVHDIALPADGTVDDRHVFH